MTTTADRCQAWREDDDGNTIQTEGVCDLMAEWISCVPFVGARTCGEHKCRCAIPLVEVETGVSPESGAPWKPNEMVVHRLCARTYPVEASLRGLPGDHVRRWVATVDALQARIEELEDWIELERAEVDISQSYGRNTEAVRIASKIRARRGEDWSGVVVGDRKCHAQK